MSIFAFGGEMGFFLPSDSTPIESTAGGGTDTTARYNSSFARGQTTVGGVASYLQSPTIAAQSTFWFHCDIYQATAFNSSDTQDPIIVMYDAGNLAFVQLTTAGTAGNSSVLWELQTWNGSAWVIQGSFTANPTARQTIDIQVISNTASGSVGVYLGGTQRINATGIDLSTHTGVTFVRGYGRTYSLATNAYHSQWVLASETTIGMAVGTIYMSGQGNTHTWDTGGYANINELAYSDANFDQSGTAAQIEEFTGTVIPNNFTGYKVRAVAITARANNNGSAPTKLRLILRSAGTDYDNGADLALGFGYGNLCAVWMTNPATSVAFLSSELAALQYGVKSIT